MQAYKIVEKEGEEIRTLFHGVGGSRTLERGVWLEADVRDVVDGGGGSRYSSGWHSLRTRAEAERYLARFTRRTEKLHIVECEVSDTWEKEHSRHPVLLSRYIRFPKEDV